MPLDAYHARASECLKLAQTSPTAQDQVTWSELALYWLRLSEFADQYRHEASMWSNGLLGEVLAAIGRHLRAEYDLAQPVPARLVNLLRQLDQ